MPLALTFLTGLATGLGLIVAIGAQNAYVLRLGISGPARAIFVVVSICALSDAVLIVAGVLGVGVLVQQAPFVIVVLRVIGAGFLIVYGVFAARRAVHPKALEIEETPVASSGAGTTRTTVRSSVALRTAALTALAFTWLNPHVYLDTVLLVGSIASTHGAPGRWWFAAGAGAASISWFTALGFGARALTPVFRRRNAWRVLDGGIAVVMLALATSLLIGA